VLGFGNRLVFWVSGCPFTCKGCIEEKLQSDKLGQEITSSELFNQVNKFVPQIDGITFSGGEPLAQSESIIDFLTFFPNEIDKMLFTGYNYNELNELQLNCFNQFDLVIEGRFELKKMGDYLWRGSSNQIFISPTHKYNSIIEDLYLANSAGLDIKVNKKLIHFYGIPTHNDEIEKVRKKLKLKDVILEFEE
jgi:anaerobic ribonucleoside-triphosphate reductase activating protein